MVEVPPASRDADMVKPFARIGIEAGLDVDAQDPSTKRGLIRAGGGPAKRSSRKRSQGVSSEAGQWLELSAARYGKTRPRRDWLFRAVQMLAGFAPTIPMREPERFYRQ